MFNVSGVNLLHLEQNLTFSSVKNFNYVSDFASCNKLGTKTDFDLVILLRVKTENQISLCLMPTSILLFSIQFVESLQKGDKPAFLFTQLWTEINGLKISENDPDRTRADDSSWRALTLQREKIRSNRQSDLCDL